MRDTNYKIHDTTPTIHTNYKMQNIKLQIHNTKYKLHNTKCETFKIQKTKYKIWNTKHETQNAHNTTHNIIIKQTIQPTTSKQYKIQKENYRTQVQDPQHTKYTNYEIQHTNIQNTNYKQHKHNIINGTHKYIILYTTYYKLRNNKYKIQHIKSNTYTIQHTKNKSTKYKIQTSICTIR